MSKAEDLTGRRFGRYVVTERAATICGNTRWTCQCACGSIRTVQAGTLRAGTAQSCGCIARDTRRTPSIANGIVSIPITKGLFATVDEADRDLGKFNWSAHETQGGYYAARRIGGNRIFLHRVVAQRAGHDICDLEVDHKNGDRLDCRRSNLRPATHAQNGKNQRLSRNNTSGFKGVRWHRHSGLWHASIVVDGKTISLGYWVAKEDAAAAYAKASVEFHGEFGRAA
jgi:hypothetical protein